MHMTFEKKVSKQCLDFEQYFIILSFNIFKHLSVQKCVCVVFILNKCNLVWRSYILSVA